MTTSAKSKKRIKQTGEVFTPDELVAKMLYALGDIPWQEGKTFLDPTCGNGNFLVAILYFKKYLNHHNPLATIFGVDLMKDNIKECKERLLKIAGDTPENRAIVDKNILCKNGLKYNYNFKGKNKMNK